MKARSHLIAFSHDKIFYALLGVVTILILLYAYFVIGTILEIVLRQELEVALKEKHSSLGVLESQYLQKEESLTLSYASEKGFVPMTGEEFASRSTLSRISLGVE